MTRYYLVNREVEKSLLTVEETGLSSAISTWLSGKQTGEQVIILQSFRTATKGEAPILFDTPLPEPPPKKRGRPRKPKDKAPDKTMPAPVIIDSLAAPDQPDPEDGLFRAALLVTIRGKPDKHIGAGMTRRSAVESAMDLFALTVSEINASPDTPGKAALLEALE